MSDAGMSPAQQRAKAAEAMAFDRAHRSLTPGEALKARMVADDTRAAQAGRWVAIHMPDLVDSGGGVCSFAIAVALRIRRERPDILSGELVALVRAQREVWMRRCGAWEDAACREVVAC